MKQLSCPLPADLDILKNNGFRFSISKLPEVTFFCQEANLPSLELPAAVVPTPLIDYPVPGDKLEFGSLSISFLIDSTMTNYKSICAWLVGLGFPQKHDQYKAFLKTFGGQETSPLTISQSDGTLQVLTGTNTVSQTIQFVGLQPTQLSEIQFVTDNQDVVYLTAQAAFAYSYYYFV